MIALLRRHCFLLAAGILLWQGWAASEASPAAPPPAADEAAPMPPPELSAADLAWRDENAAELSPADPFYLRELLMRRAADYHPAPAGSSSNGAAPAQQTLTPMVRLTLQSTMPGGARGRAWINGHDLAIGDAIPGVAEDNPPVLKSVAGSTVTIAWAGRDYLLDLYGTAAVEVPVVKEESQ